MYTGKSLDLVHTLAFWVGSLSFNKLLGRENSQFPGEVRNPMETLTIAEKLDLDEYSKVQVNNLCDLDMNDKGRIVEIR